MNILYTTDGSEGALAGARLLAQLPLDAASEIRVLTVAEDEDDAPDAGQAALRSATEALDTTPVTISNAVRRGSTSSEVLEEILDAADEFGADLVVVGTRGQSAIVRFLLGSIATRVARYTPCPALLARPMQGTLDRVLLAVDGSECAQHAAEWLLGFPLPDDCEVRLVNVVTPAVTVTRHFMLPAAITQQIQSFAKQERNEAQKRLDAIAERFHAAGRHTVTEVRDGDAAAEILGAAGARKTDLIVVGAQGMSALDEFLLGSVSEKVLRHAPCSVLVVRTAKSANPA